jgi:ribonucleoside-diphosphate reductase subunit M2
MSAMLTAGLRAEPLTIKEVGRHTILPIRYPDLWQAYKTIEGLYWPATDPDLSLENSHWLNRMTPGDRGFYTPIFALLGPADEWINENLDERFLREFQVKEVLYAYGAQRVNEQAHSESYSRQIQAVFGEDQAEIFQAADTMPIVAKIKAWVDRWVCSDEPLGTRVAAFAFLEGGIFQGLFMALQLLKERNIMPGVTMLNELIARDEGIHCLLACMVLNNHIQNRPSQERVHQIMTEAVSLFDEFLEYACGEARRAEGLSDSAPCPVKFVTEDKMRLYVRSVFDAVSADMGYSKLFGAENPYPESVKLSLNAVLKANFFEHMPTAYSIDINFIFQARIEKIQGKTFAGRPFSLAAELPTIGAILTA